MGFGSQAAPSRASGRSDAGEQETNGEVREEGREVDEKAELALNYRIITHLKLD